MNNFILYLKILYICINLFKNLSIFWFDSLNIIEHFFHTFPISMFQNGIRFLFACSICCFDMISKFIIYFFCFCLLNLLFQIFFLLSQFYAWKLYSNFHFLSQFVASKWESNPFLLFSLLLLMRFKYFGLLNKMRFNPLSRSINYFKMKLFFFGLFNLLLQNEIQIIFCLFHLLFLMKFKSLLFVQLIIINLCACLIDFFKIRLKSFCLLNLLPQMRFRSCLITQFDVSKQNLNHFLLTQFVVKKWDSLFCLFHLLFQIIRWKQKKSLPFVIIL